MLTPPIFRIASKLTNKQLIKEKQKAVRIISNIERGLIKTMILNEDDKFIYSIYLDRLDEILKEIGERIEKEKWILRLILSMGLRMKK